MREIPLTRGFVALVDDADYEWINQCRWKINTYGYAFRQTKTETISMHRLIADTPKGMECDHINHEKLDNRRANLRNCTSKENCRNKKQNIGTSAYKGVYFNKSRGKWRADIRIDYKLHYLGCFTSEIDAARAYDAAAREHFGEFAHLNFPD